MTTTNAMPKIDLDQLYQVLDAGSFALVDGIVNHKTGRLRATKPELPHKVRFGGARYTFGYTYDYATEEDGNRGKTAYIWRMVAFYVSPHSEHQCMPVCADMDLPGRCMEERRSTQKALDILVDAVLNAIDPKQWHGIRRWGQALGLTGTPRYNAEGAVIYR